LLLRAYVQLGSLWDGHEFPKMPESGRPER
jgi:hypothetical protein